MNEEMDVVQPETTDMETLSEEADAATQPDVKPEAADSAAETGEPAEGTAPAATEREGAGGPAEEAAAPPTVTVKYNKQQRELSLDEAAPYVEMGMKYESFKPTMEKLKFLAETTGTPVADMVDRLVDGHAKHLYTAALEETGGNEAAARKMADLQMAEHRRKFEEAARAEAKAAEQDKEDERATLEQRLAGDFLELQREMKRDAGTKLESIADVPKTVMQLAVKRGIPLYDAWLRQERAEGKKAGDVRKKQEQTAAQSAGALGGGTQPPGDPNVDAFSKAFASAW